MVLGPLIFITGAWVYGGGLPYFSDANETFLSYAEGRTMYLFDPRAYAFLTPGDRVQGVPPETLYTHQPNLPRYVHWLLFYVGVQGMPAQVLIITLVCTLLTMLLQLRVFRTLFPGREHIWLVVPLVFAADFMGFLSFAGNSYQVFAFLLFWASFASVVLNARPLFVVLAFFALFQFSLAFALFVALGILVVRLLYSSGEQTGGER